MRMSLRLPFLLLGDGIEYIVDSRHCLENNLGGVDSGVSL